MSGGRETVEVDPALFRAVYDSPASLPGRHRWTTPESDVRRLEKLLDMPAHSVGAPIDDLRSFKCHNWAYTFEALEEIVERMSSPVAQPAPPTGS